MEATYFWRTKPVSSIEECEMIRLTLVCIVFFYGTRLIAWAENRAENVDKDIAEFEKIERELTFRDKKMDQEKLGALFQIAMDALMMPFQGKSRAEFDAKCIYFYGFAEECGYRKKDKFLNFEKPFAFARRIYGQLEKLDDRFELPEKK
jgi:hypothetical protein